MKFAGLSLLAAFFFPALAGEIHLLNGDRLTGRIVEMNGGVLMVEPDWGGEPIGVPARHVLLYDGISSEENTTRFDARIEFANGDHVEARLIELDDNHVTLGTAWNPSANVRRNAVTRIVRLDSDTRDALLGLGPVSAWQSTLLHPPDDIPVEMKSGRIVLPPRTVAGRRLPEVPRKFSMTFEMDPPDDPNSFGMMLDYFTRDMNPGNENWMQLQFSKNFLFVRMQGSRARNAPMEGWRVIIPNELFQEETWRITLRGDFSANRYVLDINGNVLHEWVPHSYTPPRRLNNRWFKVSHQQGREPLLIKDLVITSWDGRTEEEPPDNTRGDKEIFFLQNGDLLAGRLLDVREGRARIVSEERGALEVPWNVIRQVRLARDVQNPPRIRARDVRLVANQRRDTITLSLGAWGNGELTGTSDAWVEPQTLPVQRIDSVGFNIHMRNRPTSPSGPRPVF